MDLELTEQDLETAAKVVCTLAYVALTADLTDLIDLF